MMDRKRIADEVIELLCNKLPSLPLPADNPDFDYMSVRLIPDITSNDLDIAEISMDIEDAFEVAFAEYLPGSEGLPTISSIVDYIESQLNEQTGELTGG